MAAGETCAAGIVGVVKFGVLGTGMVGRAIGGKLVELGHEVMIGSREAGPDKGSFADAAAFGEVIVNATAGTASLDALHAAGADSLAGKVLIDVANPLVFGGGGPPTLGVCNDACTRCKTCSAPTRTASVSRSSARSRRRAS